MLSLINFHCYDTVFSFSFLDAHVLSISLFANSLQYYLPQRQEMDNLVFIPLEGLFDIQIHHIYICSHIYKHVYYIIYTYIYILTYLYTYVYFFNLENYPKIWRTLC